MEKSRAMFALAVIVVVAAVAAVAAAAVANDSHENHGDIEITDVRGRNVTVPSDVDRIVCLSAGTVRLMAYFDAVDMIVGVDGSDACIEGPDNYLKATYRIAYPEIRGIEYVGDESEASYRAIVAVNPQVIISSKVSVDVLDNLQSKTGVPVVAVAADGSIAAGDEDFKKNIRLVGKLLGREERAEEIIDGTDRMISELGGYASCVPVRPKAYIGGMFYMNDGGFTETSGKYLPFDLAGVENVMPEKGGNPYPADIKSIVGSGAEYVFVDSMTYGQSKRTFDGNRDTLDVLPAVNENSAYDKRMFSLYTWKYYGTNWEAELMNAYFIGAAVNPEAYSYDADEKIDAVLALFYPDAGITAEEVAEKQGHGAEWLDW